MEKSRVPVSEEDRAKILLWCARHCCFCGKACTVNIVIHHIDSNPSNNDLDNLIPVCFDCHDELERYNPEHPLGTKYRHLEIKTRRDQIYETYTRDYLRQVEIRLSRYDLRELDQTSKQTERPWGDISCSVRTLSQDIPVKLRLCIKTYHENRPLVENMGDLYSGEALWNLNPSFIVYGHFSLPIKPEVQPFHFRAEVFWSVIDVLEREHEMLSFSYVWTEPTRDWWFDPRTLYKP
jgi:hypothetical protein